MARNAPRRLAGPVRLARPARPAAVLAACVTAVAALAGCGAAVPAPVPTPSRSAPTADPVPVFDANGLPAGCDSYPSGLRRRIVAEEVVPAILRTAEPDDLGRTGTPEGWAAVQCSWHMSSGSRAFVFEVTYEYWPGAEEYWREHVRDGSGADGRQDAEGIGDEAMLQVGDGTGSVEARRGDVVIALYAGSVPQQEVDEAFLREAALAAFGQVRA